LNTALIISNNELHGLSTLHEGSISEHFLFLINKFHEKADECFNLISILQEKRMARYDGHSLILEPFLKLIITEACAAKSLYEPSQNSYALECPNMHLLFTRYERAENMWRITPYKDNQSLLSSYE